MLYRSTNYVSDRVDFRSATIAGQPPDKGLYFPVSIPTVSPGFIKDIQQLSKDEIAFRVIHPYVSDTIPENTLRSIIEQTVNFEFPVIKVQDNIYSLELFHGPTMAFKDVGAKFMSGCMEYFVRNDNRKLIVLTATSGDTGGAVANGFYGKEGIDVVILYPSGKVSAVQEMQLTRLGANIHAIEVKGSFDDCQRMVKDAFADSSLTGQRKLTSANSINVARWLPQQFYYFYAYREWKHDVPPVFSVPSGNFGNLCAGMLAYRSGLPVKHFVAACNENDVVPQFLETGVYQPKPAVATISNAMDVGDPSNFVRIMQLFEENTEALKTLLSGFRISDNDTREAMKRVYNKTGYILDPHGAVAFASLEKYLASSQDQKGIFLETAHPLKFHDVVEPLLGMKLELPEQILKLLKVEKKAMLMDAQYENLKDYLLSDVV